MIIFHRFLIGTAIVFCAGFAVWTFLNSRSSGSTGAMLLSLAFGVAAIGLSYYLKNLKRFLHR